MQVRGRRAVHELGRQSTRSGRAARRLPRGGNPRSPARLSHGATFPEPRRRTRFDPSANSPTTVESDARPTLIFACRRGRGGPAPGRSARPTSSGPGSGPGDAGEPGAQADAGLLGHEDQVGRTTTERRRARAGHRGRPHARRSSPAQPRRSRPAGRQRPRAPQRRHRRIARSRRSVPPRSPRSPLRCARARAAAAPGRSAHTASRCASDPAAVPGPRISDNSPRHSHPHRLPGTAGTSSRNVRFGTRTRVSPAA